MTVESVDKRERRLTRQRRMLGDLKKSASIFKDPYEALRYVYGLYSIWESVKRVAAELLNCEVKDVFVAWQIVRYVRDLPDGKERLRAALDAAIERWEAEAGS